MNDPEFFPGEVTRVVVEIVNADLWPALDEATTWALQRTGANFTNEDRWRLGSGMVCSLLFSLAERTINQMDLPCSCDACMTNAFVGLSLRFTAGLTTAIQKMAAEKKIELEKEDSHERAS